MANFDRCIYCFAPKADEGTCRQCGYDNEVYSVPCWWLTPGSVLKGRYVVGRALQERETELSYLCWDMEQEKVRKLVEFYPQALVTRDITYCDAVSCIPGNEDKLEQGKQAFFEKAKLFYKCSRRVGKERNMDFIVQNNTCYYVRSLPEKMG